MKRILLINPWIHDFAAYDLWMKPMGLLYLGSILRKNGFSVSLIDCLDPHNLDPAAGTEQKLPKRKHSGKGHFLKERIAKPVGLHAVKRYYYRFGISPERFHSLLKAQEQPDLVLVTSMMTYWYPGVIAAIDAVRTVFPQAPVILGGIYATLCPDHARRYAGADEIIEGNGETHLRDIVNRYLRCDLIWTPDPENLDTLPYPAFDLLHPVGAVPLLTSRGCPYHCTYCASGHSSRTRFLQRKPPAILDEIEFWYRRFDVRHFAFYDDALLVNAESVMVPMLQELIRRELDCCFHCPNGLHLREISPHLADLMYRAGFKTLRFGFETADSARQSTTGGKVRTHHLLEASQYLREAGYTSNDIGVYLLCGLPGQNPAEIHRSIDLVHASGCKPVLTEYSPIPGTALWQESVNASAWDITGEPLFHNNTLLPCRTPELSDEIYHDLKQRTRLPIS